SLVGAAPGETTYYLVEHFHGLSTTIASHAQAAQEEFGEAARAMAVKVNTLAALCSQHGLGAIDFLKVDVEGAEPDVLRGGDWRPACRRPNWTGRRPLAIWCMCTSGCSTAPLGPAPSRASRAKPRCATFIARS